MPGQQNGSLVRYIPRGTLRLQLALLYAGLFFGLGVVLLAIAAGFTQIRGSSSVAAGSVSPGAARSSGAPLGTTAHALIIGGVIALGVTVALSLVLGWLIAGRFLRPLRTMNALAREISATNLNRRLDLGGPMDELTELGRTLDDLFARLEAAFSAQRRFIANAAHELRTPRRRATLLQVALADPHASTEALRSTCAEVLHLGQQQHQLIDALLTLASSEGGIDAWQSIDLAGITRDVILAREAEFDGRGIRIDAQLGSARAVGDERLVECLVTNLIDNGFQHNTGHGWVEVITATRNGSATLTVRNSGPVIPDDAIDRLFEPFQRLSHGHIRRSDGHGLGLAIVQAIVNAHDARLSTRARLDGGLDITVAFRTSTVSGDVVHRGNLRAHEF